MGDAMEIVGEAVTLTDATSRFPNADAFVLTGQAIALSERSRDMDVADEPLTARELEVLELLAEGLPNKSIADRLHISDQTVKFHVSSICGKLGVRNRTSAVRAAVRRGILTL